MNYVKLKLLLVVGGLKDVESVVFSIKRFTTSNSFQPVVFELVFLLQVYLQT